MIQHSLRRRTNLLPRCLVYKSYSLESYMHVDQCSAAATSFLFPLVAAICFLGRYSRSHVYVREQNIWSSTVSTATYGGTGCNSPIYSLLLV